MIHQMRSSLMPLGLGVDRGRPVTHTLRAVGLHLGSGPALREPVLCYGASKYACC